MKTGRMRYFPILCLLSICALAPIAAAAEPWADGVFRAEDFVGREVGVATGTIYAEVVVTHTPGAIPAYFTSKHDAYGALEVGKVVGVLDNEVSALKHQARQPWIKILKPRLTNVDCALIVRKGNKALREELNAFIKKIRADGTYDDMLRRWLEEAETPPMPVIETPGGNGTLAFGSAGITDGFSYFKDGELIGFDIEFARRFARETGRKLEMSTMEFGALIPAVNSGKLDFAGNLFTITAERAKNVDFTDPYYASGAVACVFDDSFAADNPYRLDLEKLRGKRVGVITGTIFDRILAEKIPEAAPAYLNGIPDYVTALRGGKVDAIMDDDSAIRRLQAKYPDIVMLEPFVSRDEYGIIVAKDNTALKAELDDFIAKIQADGTYDDMLARWLDTAEPPPMPAIAAGTGDRVLKFGTAGTAEGFSYFENGEITGFDVEFARRFASHAHARLEIAVTDFGALIPSVQSGKTDFAGCVITITEERRKNVGFTVPYYVGGSAIGVLRDRHLSEPEAEPAGFWRGMADSFNQNLVFEGRWKLMARGLAVTLTIACASFILGTILAFLVCY